MFNDYNGKAVLITGGTKGIGLASGLAFGRHGAHVILTHRWGSADEDQIRAQFAEVGAHEPLIVEADASHDADTKALLEQIRADHDHIEVFISNVAQVMRGGSLDTHSQRGLFKCLEYSSWPLVAYVQQIHKTFDSYPRYVVAMSSDGPDSHYPGYDYVALSKAVLETFVRYLAIHLYDEQINVNAIRTRQVITGGYVDIFEEGGVDLAAQFSDFAVSAEEVGNAALALCSGLMDCISGEVLTLDRGASFMDNVMTLGPRLLGAKGD